MNENATYDDDYFKDEERYRLLEKQAQALEDLAALITQSVAGFYRPIHMPRTLVKTQVGPPLGLSRRRAEGRACISGPGTPNRNRRPAEGAQSVGSFRSADTGLPAGPHFA